MTPALVLQLRQDAATRHGNARPSHDGQGMSLQENAQQDGKYFSRRCDCRQDQWIKVGNGIKNEGLTNGGANGEFDNLVQNFGILYTIHSSRCQFTQSSRNH